MAICQKILPNYEVLAILKLWTWFWVLYEPPPTNLRKKLIFVLKNTDKVLS